MTRVALLSRWQEWLFFLGGNDEVFSGLGEASMAHFSIPGSHWRSVPMAHRWLTCDFSFMSLWGLHIWNWEGSFVDCDQWISSNILFFVSRLNILPLMIQKAPNPSSLHMLWILPTHFPPEPWGNVQRENVWWMLQSPVSFYSEVPSASKSHANPCVCLHENVVFPFLQEIPSAFFLMFLKLRSPLPLVTSFCLCWKCLVLLNNQPSYYPN